RAHEAAEIFVRFFRLEMALQTTRQCPVTAFSPWVTPVLAVEQSTAADKEFDQPQVRVSPFVRTSHRFGHSAQGVHLRLVQSKQTWQQLRVSRAEVSMHVSRKGPGQGLSGKPGELLQCFGQMVHALPSTLYGGFAGHFGISRLPPATPKPRVMT